MHSFVSGLARGPGQLVLKFDLQLIDLLPAVVELLLRA
jgi:hypothetical protein